MSWWILLLVFSSQYWQKSASSSSCNTTQYEQDGRCCSLCSPGHRLHRVCTESKDTECSRCADGEYQDKWNRETSCLLHGACNPALGFVRISAGSIDRNAYCECQKGKHCSSAECETCVDNTACGPGEGVTQRANRSSDTLCTPCREGTFSNVTSDIEPCINWQICTNSQQEVHQGTSTTDVVCGPRPTNYTWLLVVLFLAVVLCIAGLFIFFRSRWKKLKLMKNQYEEQNVPEMTDEPLAKEYLPPNLPVEDQDITMQGLPFAQEQGKDYPISQEEV